MRGFQSVCFFSICFNPLEAIGQEEHPFSAAHPLSGLRIPRHATLPEKNATTATSNQTIISFIIMDIIAQLVVSGKCLTKLKFPPTIC